MEGGEGLAVDEVLAVPLPELDRAALASHCQAVAHHMSALARLFDPAVAKAAPDARKHRKATAGAEEDEKARPKRELTAYNLFMQNRLAMMKVEVR